MRRHTDYEYMLAAYDGLSPAERKEADAHLAECAECAAALAEYRGMNAEIRSMRRLNAGTGLRVRFGEAISSAPVAPTPAATRPAVREPVVRPTKPVRQPWTWSRLLLPAAFVLLLVVAIALSLPRGGGDPGTTAPQPVAAPPQQAVIVKLAFTCTSAPSINRGGWAKVIAAFQQENPDIEVEIKTVPITGTDEESYRQGVAYLAAQSDVFCAMPTMTDRQRGVVASLGPYIANDPEFNPADFYPGLLQVFDDGEVLSVPTYFQPALLKYQPELFDKAGLPYPRPGWTWDDFLAAAKALTVREGSGVTQWGYYEIGGTMFAARLRSSLNPDSQTLPDYVTVADTLKWFEKLYVDEPGAAVNAGLRRMSDEKVDTQVLDNMLAQGRVAMSNLDPAPSRAQPQHLAAYPDAGAGSSLAVYYGNLVMSGRTAHPNEAWRLLSYLSLHLPDGEAPARRSLAEQATFWQELDKSSAAAYRYALDHFTGAFYARPPDGYEYYQDAAIAVAKGEKTAEQALAELDAQVKLAAAPPQQAAIVNLTFNCDIAAYTGYDGWYKALADFKAENPDIEVNFTPATLTGSNTASYQDWMADVSARTDVFCAMPDLDDMQAGIVMNLAPYIASDPAFQPEDFYPGLLKTWENGTVLSVPTYIKPLFINYNPEAFDKAGVPYPRPGWTWDEFLATATALTQRNGAEVAQWGYYEVGAYLFTSHLWTVWSDDFQTPPDYTTMAELLRWYQKLYAESGAANMPPALDVEPGKQYENRSLEMLLRAGKVAMWEASWVSATDQPRHLATYPAPFNGSHIGRMSEMVLSGQTAHPDEAWRLVSYLSRHLPDAEVPARRSLTEKASFWQGLDESSTAVYRYMLAQPIRSSAKLPDGYTRYQDAAIAVAKGEKTAEQALADLDVQVKLAGGPTERADVR